jgi:hypothetical protein
MLVIFSPVKITMFKYIIILFVIGALLYLAKDTIKERFESPETVEYIRIVSKLSNKALQPYKGYIDNSITVNTKKDDSYLAQLWKDLDGHLINVSTGKYLTVSNDKTRVILDELDNTGKKLQKWNIESDGYITNGKLALQVEGGNKGDEAMVIVADKGDSEGFGWTTEKVLVDVKREILLEGILDGKTSKDLIETPKDTSKTFSYSLWFYANGDSYRKGQWKNIFNHGDRDTNNRSPGMWIRQSQNKFHIRCDASDGKNNGIEGTNFTFGLDKWYYLTIVFSGKVLHFFVDGQLSETFTFSGTPIIPSKPTNFYMNLDGGFDGKLANVEYVNKALSSEEIIRRMNITNPEKGCKEDRTLTSIANNLVKGVEAWTPSYLINVKRNEECPPQKLGGNTIAITTPTNKSGKLETSVQLLDSQYYDLSIWAKSDNLNGVTIRPYSGSWSGEWKRVSKNDGWVNLKWEFLNTTRASRIGYEINSKVKSRVSLFLPVLSIKVLRVDNGNIEVKEYRSNGTHSTCSIDDIGLNSIGGWCAIKAVRDEYYVEADFDKLYHIGKIHTRGRGNNPQWTTEYRVEYLDIYYGKWTQYGSKLEANMDMNTMKSNDVDILTDKIRIYPVSFQTWPSMRLGFSGSIGIKDKCKEYKVKSETHMNILERERYLKLYNKECKKISYYEYEILLDSVKGLKKDLDMKLKKAEIDSKTYESKYNEANEKLEQLERRMGGEIIVSNNRKMGKTQLDDSCNPIVAKEENTKTDKKDKKDNKDKKDKKKKVSKEVKAKIDTESMSDHQILQKLLVGMDKINADLAVKQDELEKIQKELASIDSKTDKSDKKDKKDKPLKASAQAPAPANANKQKLEANKEITKNNILILKKQLNACRANFNETKELFEGFQGSAPSPKQNVLTCNLENLSPYDIRRHKQYKKLITSIQTKMKKPEAKCVQSSETDIRKHKDYSKVVKYIYEIAISKFSDIKQNKDYDKLVKEIQQKTMTEYGRKTPNGYVKCPNECELLKTVNIENHPKFRKLVRKVVKDTIEKYGEPILGTNPLLYRKCSAVSKAVSKAPPCVSPPKVEAQCVSAPTKETCISEGFEDSAMENNIHAVNAELEKLKQLQSKCISNYEIERFDGGVTVEVYKNSSSAQKIVDNINSLLLGLNTKPTDEKANFNQIKETCRKALTVLDQMDDKSLHFIKGVYEDILAVERGEKSLSELSSKYMTHPMAPIRSDTLANKKGKKQLYETGSKHMTPSTAPITSDIQKMVKTQVMIHSNNKGIQNEKKKLEKCKTSVVKKAKEIKEKAATCISKVKPSNNLAEDVKKLRTIRKDLEAQNDVLKNKLMALHHQYETSRTHIQNYEFQNKALRADLDSLRTKCNERILKLWNENKDMRGSMSGREDDSRKKAKELYNKQKRLEEREQRLFDLRNSQMEKYAYFQNKINEQRSISNRYKAQLDNLRATIDNGRDTAENAKLSMEAQIAKVREECVDRVERYKKMFEEADKLLNELRHNSIEPKMIDKINNVGTCISDKVSTAVSKTKQNIATAAPPSVKVKTQSDIDKQLLEDMKKLVGKVDDIEKKVNAKAATSDNDNAMWYNNKYATL